MDLYAYRRQVRLNYGRPGKPTDNGFVKTFNRPLPVDYLNWFDTIDEAKAITVARRTDYKTGQPHSTYRTLKTGAGFGKRGGSAFG